MSIIRKEYTLFLLGTINKELSSCLTDFVSLAKQKKPPAPPPPPPLFLMNNMIKLDGTTTKNIWKINTVFTFYFKFCEGISHIKNVWDTATSSFICCFTSIFTSADIQHYLEKDFHHDFSFFNRFTQNSHLPFIPLVMLMP